MIDEHQLDGAIFDTVANLIVVLDSQGRVVRFNRACEQLTGRSRKEVVGRFIWDFALSARRGGAIQGGLRADEQGGSAARLRERMAHAHGAKNDSLVQHRASG